MTTRSFATNTAVVLSSQSLRYGLVFIAWAILGHYSGPEILGKVQLVVILPACAAVFVSFGLPISNSYLLGKNRYAVSSLLGNSILWALIGALLAVSALLVSKRFIIRFLPLDQGLYVAALAWIPLQQLYSGLNSMLIGERRFIENASVNILSGLTTVAAVLVAVKLFRSGATGVVITLVGATGLVVLHQFWLYRGVEWKQFIPSWPLTREALELGFRGYFGNIFQYFNYRFDTFIVASYVGATALGVYAIAYSLTEVLWFVPQGIATVLMPVTSSSSSEMANARTSRLCRISVGLSVVCGALVALLAPWAIPRVFGEQFRGSILLTWILLPGVVAFVTCKILAADLGGRGYPEYASYAALGGLLFTIFLNLLLVPHYGAIASASISSGVYFLESVYLVACYCKKVDVRAANVVVPKGTDFIQLARWAYQRASA
jgi:O-antigen/teichoic acid export membrane protein